MNFVPVLGIHEDANRSDGDSLAVKAGENHDWTLAGFVGVISTNVEVSLKCSSHNINDIKHSDIHRLFRRWKFVRGLSCSFQASATRNLSAAKLRIII